MVVKGLINANRGPNAHWNPQVNQITKQVLISYNDLNREMFDKIQQQSAQEESKKEQRQRNIASKWEQLEQRYGK